MAAGRRFWTDAYACQPDFRRGDTVASTDELVIANGASMAVTLPDPTTVSAGKMIRVKNINAASVSVGSAGTSKKIDALDAYPLAHWESRSFVSDTVRWLTM
jgi:hypothetical protein